MARRPTLEALLKFLTADMQSAFLAAIQGVVDQVILNEVVEAVIAGDADRAFGGTHRQAHCALCP